MANIAVISDLHCGHINAIAPPNKQASEDSKECWKLFRRFCKEQGPFTHVFVLGDTIDGKAGRNGGVELTTPDAIDQADLAIRVLDSVPVIKGCQWYFASGTPYHGGVEEDFERLVASSFKGVYDAIVWAKIEGYTFRLRHHVGQAMNAMKKQLEIHQRRVGTGREPQADFIIFGHVHRVQHREELINGRSMHAVTCPALQGHTQYGARRCDIDVDIGAWSIKIEPARGKRAGSLRYEFMTVPLGYETWGSKR